MRIGVAVEEDYIMVDDVYAPVRELLLLDDLVDLGFDGSHVTVLTEDQNQVRLLDVLFEDVEIGELFALVDVYNDGLFKRV